MINLKSNNAVTLVMLIITIIVLLIIAGITITLSIDSIDQTIDTQDTSEMLIIQHAIKERYVQYLETNNESVLVGTPKGSKFERELEKKDLEELGITGEGVINSTFIVNYKNGTVEKIGSKQKLEGYDKSGNTVTSNMIDIIQ